MADKTNTRPASKLEFQQLLEEYLDNKYTFDTSFFYVKVKTAKGWLFVNIGLKASEEVMNASPRTKTKIKK